ncbi:hypothetical protein EVAR_41444_1 [Eumeta japonica]|uniref:Uncharacterized protein n=1 Tax=Eumeta variegata TaxID=151549 RepID=A0A4C1W4V2_EUMVA|nr:hypothetical protein EVAR_41444_1 [Eumeta japonica]
MFELAAVAASATSLLLRSEEVVAVQTLQELHTMHLREKWAKGRPFVVGRCPGVGVLTQLRDAVFEFTRRGTYVALGPYGSSM